ncbi:MAG: RNA-binding protein [Candidatus Uhrbacteria bacterium]|nr:RNA-binding protein [Candidatus Uhrbacteria bacterium]
MAHKVFVGSLSWDTTDDSLRQAFSQAGNVLTANVISDRFSGRSRGFGFVEYDTEDEANKAIEMWNGKELDGRPIVVNLARPQGDREERPRRSSGGYGGGGNRGGGQSSGGSRW